MKKPNLFLTVILLIFCCVQFSCDKEENLIEENGLTKDINDFIPQDILDELDLLGMNINTGGKPPQIEGTFLISPYVLTTSNREGDEPGKEYADLYLSFSNQNNKDLTITTRKTQGDGLGEGFGSYIVGNDEDFTVVAKMENYHTDSNDSTITSRIFSGTISDEGIINFQTALIMIDDFGDPNDEYIEVGDCRIFNDNDGMSEKTEDLKSAKTNSNLSDLKK